jgi:hypothetical protein
MSQEGARLGALVRHRVDLCRTTRRIILLLLDNAAQMDYTHRWRGDMRADGATRERAPDFSSGRYGSCMDEVPAWD